MSLLKLSVASTGCFGYYSSLNCFLADAELAGADIVPRARRSQC